MRTDLVRLTPRTLREKLQYTDDINSIRTKCKLVEFVLAPIYEKAQIDLLLYGNAVISFPWRDEK